MGQTLTAKDGRTQLKVGDRVTYSLTEEGKIFFGTITDIRPDSFWDENGAKVKWDDEWPYDTLYLSDELDIAPEGM